MQPQEPSRTAMAAATHRAVHQFAEQGRIFADPFATTILGLAADKLDELTRRAAESASMRFFIASRSAVAEAALKAAVEVRGVAQVVVLGAGLDTFAYRNPYADRLRVFEVDHPATQSWKRRRLEAAGIEEPPWMRFAPCDFESDNLPDVLVDTGWDETQPSFFIWLGVVPYLTFAAVGRTLALLGGFGGGSEVVFDYGEPAHLLSDEARAAQARRAEAVASVGEPFLSYFEPPAIAAMVRDAGFGTIEDLGPHRLMERYLRTHAPDLLAADAPWRRRPDHGGHVLVARTCA